MKQALFVLITLSLFAAGTAEAQKRDRCTVRTRDRCVIIRSETNDPPIEFGVRGGYDFEDDVGLAGAQILIPLANEIRLAPSADVFFGDDAATEWQLNADLVLRPRALGGLYIGGGAAFMNRDFDGTGDEDTEVGYNAFGGLGGNRLADTSIRPFIEGRWTDVQDHEAFRIVAGINVPVSGG